MIAAVLNKNQGLNTQTNFISYTTMTYPIPSLPAQTVIPSEAYNEIFDIINEIKGIGENGYGIQSIRSLPVSETGPVRSSQWKNLYADLIETIYQHITGTNPFSAPANPGEVVELDYHNQMWDAAQYVLANRYTCHESQYFVDPTTGVKVNTTDGVSRRTLEWGFLQNQIVQVTKIKWPTRLLARYFFNAGSYLTWTPYHTNASGTGNPLGELDAQWAQFIRSIQIEQETAPIKYDRAAYEAQNPGTTITVYPVGSTLGGLDPTYSSGTLSIKVEVTKELNESDIVFTITFANSDSETLVVVPTVGYWNEQV
jgi:hypothetical protein